LLQGKHVRAQVVDYSDQLYHHVDTFFRQVVKSFERVIKDEGNEWQRVSEYVERYLDLIIIVFSIAI